MAFAAPPKWTTEDRRDGGVGHRVIGAQVTAVGRRAREAHHHAWLAEERHAELNVDFRNVVGCEPLVCGRYPLTTWRCGSSSAVSGTFARTSQLSDVVRPVEAALHVSCDSRALALKSTPLKNTY